VESVSDEHRLTNITSSVGAKVHQCIRRLLEETRKTTDTRYDLRALSTRTRAKIGMKIELAIQCTMYHIVADVIVSGIGWVDTVKTSHSNELPPQSIDW